ncbi:MAG: hypothetical protein PHE50_07275 [Dehalococcoidales bacterium]|nr:hypothetical protein [Dehalococcoidales bacterium]
MTKKTVTQINEKDKSNRYEKTGYKKSADLLNFHVAETKAAYNAQKPFSVYFNDPEHSIRLIKGDCIEILKLAKENSVDMIFADPPYNLSNGGITCQAGRMVSVNKGEWDKSKGVDTDHEFTIACLPT